MAHSTKRIVIEILQQLDYCIQNNIYLIVVPFNERRNILSFLIEEKEKFNGYKKNKYTEQGIY